MRYYIDGEWGGYSVSPARTGWVVRRWSRESRTRTGRVVLVRYCEDFPRSLDLAGAWNRWMTAGERVYLAACDGGIGTRLLRRGEVVA